MIVINTIDHHLKFVLQEGKCEKNRISVVVEQTDGSYISSDYLGESGLYLNLKEMPSGNYRDIILNGDNTYEFGVFICWFLLVLQLLTNQCCRNLSKDNPMKILLNNYCLFLFLTVIALSQSYELRSEEMENTVPNALVRFWPAIKIDKRKDISEINRFIKSDNDYRNSREKKYYRLDFINMDEQEINLAINKLDCLEYIYYVSFFSCSIKNLPIGIRDFQNLHGLYFVKCHYLKSLNGFNCHNFIFEIGFEECNIEELPQGISSLKPMLNLFIFNTSSNKVFDINKELSKFVKRNNIIYLIVSDCNIEKFPETLFSLTSLHYLKFFCSDKVVYPNRFVELNNLSLVGLSFTSSEEMKKIRESLISEDSSIIISYYDRNSSEKSVGTGMIYQRIPLFEFNDSLLQGFSLGMLCSQKHKNKLDTTIIFDRVQIKLSATDDYKLKMESKNNLDSIYVVVRKTSSQIKRTLVSQCVLVDRVEFIDLTQIIPGDYEIVLISKNKTLILSFRLII